MGRMRGPDGHGEDAVPELECYCRQRRHVEGDPGMNVNVESVCVSDPGMQGLDF